jgi:hypothetical protein
MFGKILGKKENSTLSNKRDKEILEKVQKMTLTEMRDYLKNKILGFESCEQGVSAVMNRLITKDASSKRYIESDSMDSKIKKTFELVLIVASHRKVTVKIVEQIQEFIKIYHDLISKYDKENKQIYGSRLKEALTTSISNINKMAELNRKNTILGE